MDTSNHSTINNKTKNRNHNRQSRNSKNNRSRSKVVRYKKRSSFNLNAGILVFGVIILYVLINMIVYFTMNRVSYYEVVSGDSADDSARTFRAVALRNETVSYASSSGKINFYSRENSRVSKKTTLYTIDESGQINNLLNQLSDEDKKLSDEDILSLKESLYSFSSTFDPMEFNKVYDFKNNLQGMIFELINLNALQSIYANLGDSQDGKFVINSPENSGIVEYYIDNYETITSSDIKESLFDEDNYTAVKIQSGDLIQKGNPIYKTINSEQWQLVIPLDDDNYLKYKNTTVMRIRFKSDNTKVTTNFQTIIGTDGKYYGLLTFQKYMIKYAQERFIDIEVLDYNIVKDTESKPSEDNNSDEPDTNTEQEIDNETENETNPDSEDEPLPENENEDNSGDEESEDEAFGMFDRRIKLKIPISSVINKDFYVIPLEYLTSGSDSNLDGFIIYDPEIDAEEGLFTPTDIFYSDDKYAYVSKSKLEAGQVIVPPADAKTDDTYIVKETQGIPGVYNINNGYTQFTGVEIISEAGEYYIVYALSPNNLMLYDHIILNADKVDENQVIFQTQ